jgi:chemotaxis protein MotA
MDLGTVIGFGGFWAVIAMAMIMACGIGPFIDPVSLVIVFLGTTVAIISSFDLSILANFTKLIAIAFKKLEVNHPKTVEKITNYSMKIKKDGKQAIQTDIETEDDFFLKEAMEGIMNNLKPEEIETIYGAEMAHIQKRHDTHIQLFKDIGGIAGSMGMIGTLVGLVAMLLNMSDPAAIGPAMAVALLTTLYGALIGGGFANPIASKLGLKDGEEQLHKQIVLKGAVYIAEGQNPRAIEKKLMAMIPPNKRTTLFV